MDLSAVSKATIKAESTLALGKYTPLVVPVVSILISVAILLLIVWPKASETLQIKNSNSDLSNKANSLAQKAALLANLDQEELEKQVVAAEQLMPSDKDVFVLVSQIESAAGSSGVLLNRVESAPGSLDGAAGGSPASPPPAPDGAQADIAPKIELGVSLTSGYSSLLSFLSNVLAIPRTVSISNLSISASSSEGSVQLKTTMTIIAYYKELPKDLGSIETPIVELTQAEQERLRKIIDTGLAASLLAVPEVPVGREDIFAPF